MMHENRGENLEGAIDELRAAVCEKFLVFTCDEYQHSYFPKIGIVIGVSKQKLVAGCHFLILCVDHLEISQIHWIISAWCAGPSE